MSDTTHHSPLTTHHSPLHVGLTPQRSPTIYGYVRVSTDKQDQEGEGKRIQRQQCQAYLAYVLSRPENASLTQGEIFEEREGVSAYKVPFQRRWTGQELDRRLQPGDHVVFARLDRSFRNAKDCFSMMEAWHKRGIVVHFADLGVSTNSANGWLVMALMAVCAQWSSRMTSERMKDVFALKRMRGEIPSGGGNISSRTLGANGTQSKPGYVKKKIVNENGERTWRWVPDRQQMPILRLIAYYRERCSVVRSACVEPSGQRVCRRRLNGYAVTWQSGLAGRRPSWKQIGKRVELAVARRLAQRNQNGVPPNWSAGRCEHAYQQWKERFQPERLKVLGARLKQQG